MTEKQFNLIFKSTLHSLVFLSLCLAPLLQNVLNQLQSEASIEARIASYNETLNKASSTNSEDASEDANKSSQVGLSHPLKSFWSLTRLSQRYFTQRKINSAKQVTSFEHYSKTFQTVNQSALKPDLNFVLTEHLPHLAESKRYLSHAKLQLEGG